MKKARRVRSPSPPRMAHSRVDAPVTNIREHILDRTIYLMGREGTTDVPIRAIAKEAGVNVAAVNYYFSSKDQMLSEMAKRFMLGFEDVMTFLDDPALSPEERLRRWAIEVMRYLAEYPGILPLMERQMAADPLNPFGKVLRSTIQLASRRIRETIGEMIGTRDGNRLSFKLTLLVSAIAGPFPQGQGQEVARRTFRGMGQRARFLDLLIEHLRQ